MKLKSLLKLTAAGVLTAGLAAPVHAADQSIFELGAAEAEQGVDGFKPAPARIETSFGTLDFVNGAYPTPETAQKVYDELDLQRATQLYLDLFPALSVHGILKAQVRDFGHRNSSDICVTPQKMNANPLFLTGNTDSIYAWMTLDLKAEGPTVMEIPPNVMGPLDDAYFRFVVDFGATGPDKGKGGKYLILPPDYEGDVPEGYFVARSKSYRNWGLVRANTAVIGTGDEAMQYYRDNLRIYPLETGPREGRYIDCGHMPGNSLVPEDGSAFRWLHEIVSYEPADLFDKEQLGRLASLGIEKGKPFNPDARMQAILEQAARQGVAMSRVITFASRDPEEKLYEGMSWGTPFIGGNAEFEKDGHRNLDARTLYHYNAIVVTPAMAATMPAGKGSKYSSTYVDGNGAFLDGGKIYKLRVPPNVPVREFWSVTVYDPVTRSQLQTAQPLPSISSQENPPANADGSVDIYFAAEKPDGVAEQNWIQTAAGKGFFPFYRFYGPLEAFNDQSWKPVEIEEVR
ncbi:DUF1254 domain-containing protein [Aliiruegeria sabulilitoris]|uniref:DUF1254 domain-containing protein n=1 Tax=Aliiruegeria sabulilitoris TaxID=1510458 RepID=UPI0008356156|nr:DUF1254 domain-containing protein [Aliiruegeria sabulilitoris]NDR58743.1 DUF1254 domain-containing protein [Pseudoruegeria sp. M32A2M]